jgi:predicted O-methyltransferase YrrM
LLERALSVEGLTKHSELEVLHDVARTMPVEAVVVEIGSFRGRSTLAIAEGLDAVTRPTLIAVDTFGGDPGWENRADPREARAIFDRNTAGIEFLRVVQASSIEAAGDLADRSVDWVFIDALHDYRSVVGDIRAWAPKLKPGGLLSGHDWGRAGVTDAVLRVFRPEQIEFQHSIWMTRAQPRLRPTRVGKHAAKRLLRRYPAW